MASIAPRRTCEHCERSIAVVAGRLARHDPIDRGPLLLSCAGSLRPAPMLQEPDRWGTHSLFEVLAEFTANERRRLGGRAYAAPAAAALFSLPPDIEVLYAV